MTKAIDVAKYFLPLNQRLSDRIKKEDNDNTFQVTPDTVTHLKIQKLVYYAQGLHLYYFDKPLFADEIQAWKHGPVVAELYMELSKYKDKDLMQCFENLQEDELCLSCEQKEVIQLTFMEYAKFSASALRNKTHEESPWSDVYEKDKNNVITHEKLKEFFTKDRKRKIANLYRESEQFRCLFS